MKIFFPIVNKVSPVVFILTFVLYIFRYSAVCTPYRYRLSHRNTNNVDFWSVGRFVIPIIIISTGYNIPKFFETELVRKNITLSCKKFHNLTY